MYVVLPACMLILPRVCSCQILTLCFPEQIATHEHTHCFESMSCLAVSVFCMPHIKLSNETMLQY